MDLIKRLEQLNKERFDIIFQLAPEVEKALQRLEFPSTVDSIGWAQYTPYDDADFYVYCDVDSLFINGKDINDSEFGCRLNKTEYKKNPLSGKYEEDVNLIYDEEAGDFANQFIDLINRFPEEVLKEAFGDHCQVTLHKSGEIKVDSYEHD